MEDIHITVEPYQKKWLEEQGISPSAILQKEIDRRMEEYGFDPDRWGSTYGE